MKSKEQFIEEVASSWQRVTGSEDARNQYTKIANDLWQNEQYYWAYFYYNPLGISIHLPDGRFLWCNPSVFKMLGYSTDELLVQNPTHPDDQEEGQRLYEALLGGDSNSYHRTKRFIHRDGRIVWARQTTTKICDAKGQPLYIIIMIEDITEQRQAELELRQSQTRLSLLNSISTQRKSGLSVEQIIEQTLQRIQDVFKEFRVCYSTIDETSRISILYSLGPSSMPVLTGQEGNLETIPEYLRALREGEPIIAADVLLDVRLHPFADAIAKTGVRAILDIPLKHSTQLVGLLCFSAEEPRTWRQYEIATLTEVADYLSMLIKEARQEQKRQHAETALRKSEQRFRQIAEHIDGVFWIDEVALGKTVYVSPAYERIWRRSCQSLYSDPTSWLLAVHPADRQHLSDTYHKAVKEATNFEIEYRIILPDESIRWIRSRGFPIRDESEHPYRYAGIAEDVTRHKQVELTLKASEEKWRSLVENAPDIIVHIDRDGTIQFANQIMPNLTPDQVIGQRVYKFIPAEHHPTVRNAIERVFQTGMSDRYEVPTFGQNNQLAWYASRISPIKGDGEVIGATIITTDITNRKKAEEESRTYARMLETIQKIQSDYIAELSAPKLFDNVLLHLLQLTDSQYGFIGDVLHKDGHPYLKTHAITNIAWNEETRRFYDDNAPQGMEFFNLNTLFGQVMVTGEPVIANQPSTDSRAGGIPEGHPPLESFLGVPLYCRGTLVGIAGIANRPGGYDQTLIRFLEPFLVTSANLISAFRNEAKRKEAEEERIRLEAQLRQLQKMETIGTLAGGIAHDFNNLLTPIVAYTEMIQTGLVQDPETIRAYISKVDQAAKHATALVKQILTFSRQAERERQPLQPVMLLNEALKLLRASLPSTIEIRSHVDPECGLIFADPTQIHQVVMNLCTNAYHAMRERGGVLDVRVERVRLDAEFVRQIPNLVQGTYIRLSVGDTGHGMTAATLERIFDPFFSTKEAGEGTGLGLSVAHGIITAHNGAITVQSHVERGSIFEVYLPPIDHRIATGREYANSIITGTEHILFVDDEEPVAFLGKEMLTKLGYRVTVRTSSIEALEAFRARPTEFDIVVTDMTMPHLTGIQLARELMAIRSEMPIILMTGYSELITPEAAKQMGLREFIMKPLGVQELGEAIRRTLDSAGT